MLNAYENAAREYRQFNKTNGIPSEAWTKFPFAGKVDNDLRSAIEVFEFINTPPSKYFLYINESNRTATTWTGQKLGSVCFGREYRGNFGDKRQSVIIHAINGKTYSGVFLKVLEIMPG